MQPTLALLIEKVQAFRKAIAAVEIFTAIAIAGEIATIIKDANIQIPKFWARIDSSNRDLSEAEVLQLNQEIDSVNFATSDAHNKNTAACAVNYAAATTEVKELPSAIDPALIVHISTLVISLLKMFRDRQKA